MIKKLLFACLACTVTNAVALPIVFTNSLFETSAVAIAGGASDSQFGSGPPLPTTSDALVLGNDVAIASGVGDNGVLVTSADVTSAGAANAFGTSRFVGSFTGGGVFGFALDFASTDAADPGTVAASTVSVALISNGVALLDEVFTVNGAFNLARFIPVGDYTLDLLLASEATAATGGSASSLAFVNFAAPTLVPEPATWLLLLLGLLFLSVCSPRHRRARAEIAIAHR